MAQPGQQYQYPQQYQYQQYQQYSQPQQQVQYAQPQQYQQPQTYTYSTHQPQPPSYAQHYSQQCSQQYQQQTGSQQYSPPHNGSYSQQFHQQPRAPDGPPTIAEPETCYNCGLADHFAQNCPEPRREVPAGALKRQKRHLNRKPQYNTSTQVNASMQSQTYQQSPYPQQGYTQYQQTYSPATPYSAQSPTAQQWRPQPHPQQYQYQQNHQAYHQNQHSPPPAQYQAQSIHNQSQPYSIPATPAAASQYGPPQTAQPSPPASSYGSLAQTPHSAQPPQGQWTQSLFEAAPESQAGDTQKTQSLGQPEEDTEEDDLNALDVPDLPPSTKLYGEAVLKRVSRPLPANFVVADAIFPIPPPAPEAGGKCLSKYFDTSGENAILQSIKTSPYWRDHQDDTIFKQIEDAGEIIPLDVCVAKIKERQKPQLEEEVRRNSRSQSRGVNPRSSEAAEMAETLETLERALAEAKAKQAEMIRNRKKVKSRRQSDGQDRQKINAEEDSQIEVEQHSSSPPDTSNTVERKTRGSEDIHASLGVTGSSNPLSAAPGEVSQESPIDALNSSSKRSSKDVSTTNATSVKSEQQQQQGYFQGNGVAHFSSQQGRFPHPAPPPPPPPPIQTSTQDNQVLPSPESAPVDSYGLSTNGNGYFHENDTQAGSPVQNSTERFLSRKRSYDQREESSSEEDDSPRRQEDDMTPKHKKRQPKVAAAYSRRW